MFQVVFRSDCIMMNCGQMTCVYTGFGFRRALLKSTFKLLSRSDIKGPHTLPATLSPLTTASPPAIKFCEEDVCQLFHRQQISETPGPDGVSPSYLTVCANQLLPIAQIFIIHSISCSYVYTPHFTTLHLWLDAKPHFVV